MQIADMHCDTISRLYDETVQGSAEGLRANRGHLDLERMKNSGYLLQNFALFVHLKKDGDPWSRICCLYDFYQKELQKNQDLIAPMHCFADYEKNREEGKLSALLTVEEGGVCKGEIGKLRKLYEMGVRMMTLTWNYPNELGFPNRERDSVNPVLAGGLTECGKAFVEEMERLGMIPDVSHLSDEGFYDVLETTKKPFVASHSDARALCSHARNLTDEMIKKLAVRGGVMGLNYYTEFLGMSAGDISMEAFVKQARHISNVGGVEVLGLGSDFDGIDTNPALPGAESMVKLWDALKKGGFTERELDLIFADNVLRVYREVLCNGDS